MTDQDVGQRPEWDASRAEALIGETVLIGTTRELPEGMKQEQMYGVVRTANAREGFEIALGGSRNGETFWLPPDVRAFFAAAPGEYRLRSTGEVVKDPDFTTTWTFTPPKH